jgi:hypothetical protein
MVLPLILPLLAFFLACSDPLSAVDRPAATCADVCDNYRKLRCEAARETVDGDTCEEVCGRVMGSGFVEFDLECRRNASSCTAADMCER